MRKIYYEMKTRIIVSKVWVSIPMFQNFTWLLDLYIFYFTETKIGTKILQKPNRDILFTKLNFQ